MAHKCCAFTSGESVGSGVRPKNQDCRRRAGENVMVCCSRCVQSKPVWRCSCCYQKFSVTLQRRCLEIEKHLGGKLRREPALDALLSIDWRLLAAEGGYEHPALKPLEPGLFEWRAACPSC